MKKNIGKILLVVLKNIPFLVVIVLSVLLIFSTKNMPGGYRLYSVMSGSMEPAIHTGSVIAVKQYPNYNQGDIITFKVINDNNKVTHRIVSVNKKNNDISYNVKGDANSVQDVLAVSQSDVYGKVVLTIPYLGYVFGFARTMPGLLIIISLGAIIVFTELQTIQKELKTIVSTVNQKLTKKTKSK